MEHKAVAEGLKSHAPKAPKKVKHLKTFHAKEQHDGGYHVVRHSGNPKDGAMEHHAADLEAVHEALADHMGSPEESEGASGGGNQEPAGGEGNQQEPAEPGQ